MARCPGCGYELQPLENECPRCKGAPKQSPAAPLPAEQRADSPPTVASQAAAPMDNGKRKVSPAELAASGALAGAFYGTVFLVAFMFADRLLFGGSESKQLSFLAAIIGAAVAGAILGAIMGAITVLVRSVAAGIVVGAVLLGILKAVGFSGAGFGGRLMPLAVVVGLFYGAVMGWSVSSGVMKSIKWDKIK